MSIVLLIWSANSCTQQITKSGYHIDAMPVWITVADSTIVHDKINIYIQLDSSTIKQIP